MCLEVSLISRNDWHFMKNDCEMLRHWERKNERMKWEREWVSEWQTISDLQNIN